MTAAGVDSTAATHELCGHTGWQTCEIDPNQHTFLTKSSKNIKTGKHVEVSEPLVD